MIDPESQWKDAWADLPLDPTGAAWAMNMANLIDGFVTSKLDLAPDAVIVAAPSVYTWQPALFAAAIASLPPSPDPVSGRTAMANAWQTATMASTLIVSAGAAVGSPSPATIFSAPPVAVINPASLAAATSGLAADLLAAPLSEDPKESAFPVALRKAFVALKFDLTGLNSIPPPAGPTPLLAPLSGVN